MMNARAYVIVVLLVAAIGGALSYWFFTNFERAEREVEIGLKGEAIENRYLAVQRVLRRFGREVSVVRSVSELRALPERGTLLLEGRRLAYLRPELAGTLLDWVRVRGGHLIVEAESPGIEDALLKALSVATELPDEEAAEGAEDAAPEQQAGGLQFPGAARALKVEFTAPEILIDQSADGADLDLADHIGTRVLQYRLGRGAVTVMTDFAFFSYRAIGNHDHAEALWRLLAAGDARGPVWFLSQLAGPTFWAWLGMHARTVLLSAGLLLATWLAYVAPRFGPLAPVADPARRSLREHLAATGRFLWRFQGGASLLAAVRARLMQRIRARAPALANAQGETLARALAQLTGSSASTVRAALVDRADSPHGFVHIMRAIVEIDRRLDIRGQRKEDAAQSTQNRGRPNVSSRK